MLELVLHSRSATRKVQVPENWQELSAKQFIAIVGSLNLKTLSLSELHVRLVVILTQMNVIELKECAPELMYEELIPMCQWPTEQACDLVQQLIPFVRGAYYERYYGPDSELDNLRLAEYDAAEKNLYLFQELSKKGEDEAVLYLYHFVATLYRRAKRPAADGDRRKAYNGNDVAKRAKRMMKSVPMNTALAIVAWYMACRNKIAKSYPEIFGADASLLDGTQAMPDNFPLMRMIAKEGVYGDFDKVEQLYLYTALADMVEQINESERLKSSGDNEYA